MFVIFKTGKTKVTMPLYILNHLARIIGSFLINATTDDASFRVDS